MSAIDRVIACCPQCAGIGTHIMCITCEPKRLNRYHMECDACGYVSESWMVCGTEVVKLEGVSGCYAVDGLELVR